MQAVLIGERITGRGVVQAVDHAVGVPLWEIEPLLGALVLALLVGAVYPRRKFASRRSQACIAALPASLFVTVEVVFSKASRKCRGSACISCAGVLCLPNALSRMCTMQDTAWTTDEVLAEAQVWVRRLACICFAVMIVAEVITGKVRLPAIHSPGIASICIGLGARHICLSALPQATSTMQHCHSLTI